MGKHGNGFRIQFRRDFPRVFHPDLVELTAASGGGPFPAEHGAHVEHTLFHAVHGFRAGERTHDPGGPFRTQCQASAAAVFKGIHFFLNDFRLIAKSPLKHFGKLKNGGTDLTVAVK